MPLYDYVGIGADGATVDGRIDLPSEVDVAERLQRDGLFVLRVTPVNEGSAERSVATSMLVRIFGSSLGRRKALRHADLVDFTRKLSMMLGAAHDLDRALRYMMDVTTRNIPRAIIGQVRDAVREGGTLADALGRHPESFSRLYVGLVRAGEAGGTLAIVMDDLSRYLERQARQSSEIRSAMVYPALLAVASCVATVFLLTEILPQFVTLFAENGARLPPLTRGVIAAGDFVKDEGLFILAVGLVVFVCVRLALRSLPIRQKLDGLILRVPVVGTICTDVMAGRMTRTLGTLTGNGVALVQAVQMTLGVVDNEAGKAALEKALVAAREGGGLAGPLAATRAFPRATTELLHLGEETAQLSMLALKAADIHEEQARLSTDRLVALLVPAITIIMGGIVALIVTALLMAMLSLNDLAA